MAEPRYDRETLDLVSKMVGSYRGFELLKKAAFERIAKHEASLTRLIFRTVEDIDPKRIEYDRGFKQGILFALEGLPNDIINEFRKAKEADSE